MWNIDSRIFKDYCHEIFLNHKYWMKHNHFLEHYLASWLWNSPFQFLKSEIKTKLVYNPNPIKSMAHCKEKIKKLCLKKDVPIPFKN